MGPTGCDNTGTQLPGGATGLSQCGWPSQKNHPVKVVDGMNRVPGVGLAPL